MADDIKPYLQLYKERTDRITKIVQLMTILMCLTFVDQVNHYHQLLRYGGDYEIAVYDFCIEYRGLLQQWSSTDSSVVKVRATKEAIDGGVPFAIPAIDEPTNDEEKAAMKLLTHSRINYKDVPLMKAYLREKSSLVAFGDKELLGYKMNYALYLVAVVAIPTFLLISIFYNCYGLRKLRGLVEDAGDNGIETRLTLSSLAFSRIVKDKDDGWEPYVALFCTTLFLLCVLTQTMALGWRVRPDVVGVLYPTAEIKPIIEVGRTHLFNDTTMLKALRAALLIDAWLCFKIWRLLMVKSGWERIGVAWP